MLPWTPHGGAKVIGASKSPTIEEMSEEDWDFTVDRVLKGIFLSVKHEAAVAPPERRTPVTLPV